MSLSTPVRLGRRDAGLRERALGRDAALYRLDWVLALAVASLIGLGSLLVWSATRQRMIDADLDPQTFLQRHLLNAVIGLAMAAVAALVDYRSLHAYAPIIYGASVLGLVAVLTPLGSTINGAHSWIVLGTGFQVQPSEFAKVALVLGMAMLLADRRDRDSPPRTTDILAVLAIAAVPLALVMLQPDLGTALVFVFLVLGVLAIGAAPAIWLGGLVVAGVLVAGGAVQAGVLDDYQLDRFAAFTNPELDPRGAGFNSNQARIAIGSGGLLGKGLFEGTQTRGRFVPEQQTDFIFTVAGEELGLLGASTLLLLLGIVLWRGLRIASRSSDTFGRLVAAGVVAWFTFQSFVNIGMTLGIMPVTGLPLPFVSYGGSAMFANLLAVGLLQNVHLRSREL
ncbi:MAG: rod shape-determining protein RodA [Actinobacteria bacterium]|nr:rod shape-determining protein RodA [Actinomycetota bacterium]